MIATRKILVDTRKKKGFTQQKLADEVGITRAYLSNIEKGKYTPSLLVARKIAERLNMSVEDLFF